MIGHSQERQKSTAESSIRTSKTQMLAMRAFAQAPVTWLCNKRFMMIEISW